MPEHQTSSASLIPAEVPQGRVVKVIGTAQRDYVEQREIEYNNYAGYVDEHDLRLISPIKFDPTLRYYAGGKVLAYGVKPCWITRSISSVVESSTDLSIGATLSNKIAEIQGSIKRSDKNSEKSEDKLPADIEFGVAKVVQFGETYLSFPWFFRKPEPKQTVFTFVSIGKCESAKSQIIVEEGNRQVVLDGPMVIQNEDHFQKFSDLLIDGRFTPDEAFFIIGYLAQVRR